MKWKNIDQAITLCIKLLRNVSEMMIQTQNQSVSDESSGTALLNAGPNPNTLGPTLRTSTTNWDCYEE